MSLLSEEKIIAIAKQTGMLHPVEQEMNDAFIAYTRAIEAAVLDAQTTDQRLLNLLCRIHRDGGHYIAEHGLDKAVEDADLRVAEQNAVLEAQGKQEPVAWRVFDGEGGYDLINYVDNEDYRDKFIERNPAPIYSTWVEPLYAAPVVQPDMVMVPREPTEAMLDAAMNRYKNVSPEARLRFFQMHRENFRCDYKAMIAAAEGKSNA